MTRAFRRVWLAALCAACATAAPGPDDPVPPVGRLISTADMRGEFSLRQRLAFRQGDAQGSVEVVVQLHCGELVVVGLTPFGAPAFTIRQREQEVQVESSLPMSLPFAPIHVLEDVQRVYFVPFAAAAPGAAAGEVVHGTQRVTDTWSGGSVVERRFVEVSGEPPGAVTVRYPGGATADVYPARIELASEQRGYTLEITTL